MSDLGGKSADKAVFAAVSLALSGRQRGRSSRRYQLGAVAGRPASGCSSWFLIT